MKSSLAVLLAVILATPVVADGLRPSAVKGAVLGGVAGAVIGRNSGDLRHNAWRGAAIGAGTGLVVGSMVGDRSDHRYRAHHWHAGPRYSSYIYRSPRVHFGYRHGGSWRHGGHRHGGWRDYGYYSSPAYIYLDRDGYGYDYGYARYDGYRPGRPSYAASGTLLGALAGAVIGNNSGDLRHNSWRGAALGAAAGYVLGSVAENNVRRREAVADAPLVTNQVPEAQVPTQVNPVSAGSSAATPVVTASEARSSSSMSSANSLFGR